jgi:hypothetical protein
MLIATQGGVMSERELKDPNQNPWCILMTLHGEQEGDEIDWELHEKNRKLWNAWACQGVTEGDLAKIGDLLPHEMTILEWSASVAQEVNERYVAEYKRRNPKHTEVPEIPLTAETVNFEYTDFSNEAAFCNLVFITSVSFSSSEFSRHANFESTVFTGPVYFCSVKFMRSVDFQSGNFMDLAEFTSVIFEGSCNFCEVSFADRTSFDSTIFGGSTDFQGTVFQAMLGWAIRNLKGVVILLRRSSSARWTLRAQLGNRKQCSAVRSSSKTLTLRK